MENFVKFNQKWDQNPEIHMHIKNNLEYIKQVCSNVPEPQIGFSCTTNTINPPVRRLWNDIESPFSLSYESSFEDLNDRESNLIYSDEYVASLKNIRENPLGLEESLQNFEDFFYAYGSFRTSSSADLRKEYLRIMELKNVKDLSHAIGGRDRNLPVYLHMYVIKKR